MSARTAPLSPYERGYAAGFAGTGRPPDFPKGDASWSEKLYARGWLDGAMARSSPPPVRP